MLFLSLSKAGTAQGLDYCHEVWNKPTHTVLYSTTYKTKYTWMGANEAMLSIAIMIY